MFQAETLSASLALNVSGEGLANEFVFLPEGEHEVSALVNGKPGTRKVTVGPDALEPLQASLSKRLARNVRPFGGFDHKDGGPASFTPKAFRYEGGRGVILEVDWTKSGKEAIEGKDYSYFSPTFYRDKKTGKPLGLMPSGEIGSLVNEPAFEAIERIAASHFQSSDMETIEELKAALTKAGVPFDEKADDFGKFAESIKANLTSAVADAVTEATKDAPEKSELEKELGVLKEKLATTEGDLTKATEALAAKRATEADDAIAEAIKAGRIPAQDEETKAFWKDLIVKDDTGKAKGQLAKLPDADALKAGRKVEVKDGENEPTGLARAIAAHKATARN